MKTRFTALAAATTLVLAGFAFDVAARGPGDVQPVEKAGADTPTLAQAMFPDAPDGVDPMPTGPVSASLRERQKALDCHAAIWPNVPAACYPN